MLKVGAEVTDMNAALFDVNNNFKGSISGIHEVLSRQGLLKDIHCINPEEKLSPGQNDEISRVINQYSHLVD